jgi:hypothetical protein
MSANGPKRTFQQHSAMSALRGKADIPAALTMSALRGKADIVI